MVHFEDPNVAKKWKPPCTGVEAGTEQHELAGACVDVVLHQAIDVQRSREVKVVNAGKHRVDAPNCIPSKRGHSRAEQSQTHHKGNELLRERVRTWRRRIRIPRGDRPQRRDTLCGSAGSILQRLTTCAADYDGKTS
jgi:hypothetical protein